MNRILWWLTDVLSEMLESSERDAVRGDLAEAHGSRAQALRDVLGLLARRQAVVWGDWQLWVTVATVIVPLSMVLSIASTSVVRIGSAYSWLYFNNWDWALLRTRGFWYMLGQSARFLAWRCLVLACWSWSVGFVLGQISQPLRTGLNAFLFCLTLMFGVLVGAPRYFLFLSGEVHRAIAAPTVSTLNDPVLALIFYRVFFPLITQVILVAVPAVWGMHEAATLQGIRPTLRRLVWTAGISSLIALVVQQPGLVFLLRLKLGMQPAMWHGWAFPLSIFVQLLHFIAYWPLAYLLATIVGTWRKRAETSFA